MWNPIASAEALVETWDDAPAVKPPESAQPSRPWLTLAEVGERLSLSPRALRVRVKDGRIKASVVGKRYVVSVEEVEAFISRVKAGTAGEEPPTPKPKPTF